VILAKASALVAERGADGVSLRELARSAGVSHAAPAYHFTDRRGLFTALATEGFQMLAAALVAVRGEFAEAALAYVGFAVGHPGHYAVMFDTSVHDAANVDLIAAKAAAGDELNRGVATLTDPRAEADPAGAALAAWSMVHGFSMLWLNKAIDTSADPVAEARRIAAMLFAQ
jgi:AcrR family transcriptional regulator